jgi:hypothetical protein
MALRERLNPESAERSPDARHAGAARYGDVLWIVIWILA